MYIFIDFPLLILDLEICKVHPDSRLVDRLLFFDLIRTGMIEIFAGEDEEIRHGQGPRINSARLRLWRGRQR